MKTKPEREVSKPMASTTPAPAPRPAVVPPAQRNEIRIVSHSALFYWWPVWAVGFLMALVTLVDGHRMVTVPKDSRFRERVPLDIDAKTEVRTILELPKDFKGRPQDPHVLMADSKTPGVLFSIVLLLVITITNVPLRGLWSVIVITLIVSISIILAILREWDRILEGLGLLDIRINFAGYMLISTVLLIIWLIVMLLFDKQIYMVFTTGQLRVRLEIGEAETAYDTTGMTIQKQRSDLFRHWILGLGSGDLIVNTAGAQAHHFDMPNVLFLGRKVRDIEEMLRSRQVVSGN
jgi:hypothetical protein